jgi:hypothetical protein
VDKRGEDAEVHFDSGQSVTRDADYIDQFGRTVNGPVTWSWSQWSDGSIQVVDSALATLHEATVNTRLLKRADGGELTIYLVGNANQISYLGGWNSSGRITVTAFGMMSDPLAFDPYDRPRELIFHEIGHNWDEAHENRLIPQFRNLSLWTKSNPNHPQFTSTTKYGETWWYRNEPRDFVSSYAMSHPVEDFADTFAERAMQIHRNQPVQNDPTALADDKLRLIDQLFATV